MLAHWLPDHVSPHIRISCSMYQFICRHLLGHGKRLSKIVIGCLLLSVSRNLSSSNNLFMFFSSHGLSHKLCLLLVPAISYFCVCASFKTFTLCVVFSTFFCNTFMWLVWIYFICLLNVIVFVYYLSRILVLTSHDRDLLNNMFSCCCFSYQNLGSFSCCYISCPILGIFACCYISCQILGSLSCCYISLPKSVVIFMYACVAW